VPSSPLFDFYSSSEASLVRTVVLATGFVIPTFLIMDLAASKYDRVAGVGYFSSGRAW